NKANIAPLSSVVCALFSSCNCEISLTEKHSSRDGGRIDIEMRSQFPIIILDPECFRGVTKLTSIEPHARCTPSLAQTKLGSIVHGSRTIPHHRRRRPRQHSGGVAKIPHHHRVQSLHCA